MILPANEAFLKQGLKSIANPEHMFFELYLIEFNLYFSKKGIIQPIEKNDINKTEPILRYLDNITHPLG